MASYMLSGNFNYKKFFIITLACGLAGILVTGCINKLGFGRQLNHSANTEAAIVIEPIATPVVTAESYQSALKEILAPFWQNQTVAGLKDQVLALTAPTEFLDLHFQIVVAFELIEQGQKEADQEKIEDGLSRLSHLGQTYSWLK